MNNHYLDVKGLNCPLPLLKLKRILMTMAEGERVDVDVTDPGSRADFDAFCKQVGHELLRSDYDGKVFSYTIKKGSK